MNKNSLLRNKYFWLQFVIAFVILIVIITVANILLRKYTNHNKEFEMPDLVTKSYDSLMVDSAKLNYQLIVTDSVYDPAYKQGVILQQNPLPGLKIKPGRKVYIVLSAVTPGQTVMPDLRDVTVRQASSALEAAGLKLGVIYYKPAFDRNAVQAQLYQEQDIAPGTPLSKGSIIDLVVGAGFDNTNTRIPFLFGKNVRDCRKLLLSAFLNIGSENYLDSRNQGDVIAYKCVPEWNADSVVEMGTKVDVYYRSKRNINIDSLKFVMLFRPEHRAKASELYEEKYHGVSFDKINFNEIEIDGEHPSIDKTIMNNEDETGTDERNHNVNHNEKNEEDDDLF